jgi:hypothetical protein
MKGCRTQLGRGGGGQGDGDEEKEQRTKHRLFQCTAHVAEIHYIAEAPLSVTGFYGKEEGNR